MIYKPTHTHITYRCNLIVFRNILLIKIARLRFLEVLRGAGIPNHLKPVTIRHCVAYNTTEMHWGICHILISPCEKNVLRVKRRISNHFKSQMELHQINNVLWCFLFIPSWLHLIYPTNVFHVFLWILNNMYLILIANAKKIHFKFQFQQLFRW